MFSSLILYPNKEAILERRIFSANDLSEGLPKRSRSCGNSRRETCGHSLSEQALYRALPVRRNVRKVRDNAPESKPTNFTDWSECERLCEFIDQVSNSLHESRPFAEAMLHRRDAAIGGSSKLKPQNAYRHRAGLDSLPMSRSADSQQMSLSCGNSSGSKALRRSYDGAIGCVPSEMGTGDRGVAGNLCGEEMMSKLREEASTAALSNPQSPTRQSSRIVQTHHHPHPPLNGLQLTPHYLSTTKNIQQYIGYPNYSLHSENYTVESPYFGNRKKFGADPYLNLSSRSSKEGEQLVVDNRSVPHSYPLSVASHSEIHRHQHSSLQEKSRSRSRQKRLPPRGHQTDLDTTRVPYHHRSSSVPRIARALINIVETERLKKELAEVTIGPKECHSQNADTAEGFEWSTSDSLIKDEFGSAESPRSIRELVRYPEKSVRRTPFADRSHQPHHTSLTSTEGANQAYSRTLSISMPNNCSQDGVSGAMQHERSSGTNRLAISAQGDGAADCRTGAMCAYVEGLRSAPSLVASLHDSGISSLNLSLPPCEFPSLPSHYMYRRMDHVLPVDRGSKYSEYDNIGGSIDRRLGQASSARNLRYSYYTGEGDGLVGGLKRNNEDVKVDEGYMVSASSRGRLNERLRDENDLLVGHRPLRRFRVGLDRQESYSRSCDQLDNPRTHHSSDLILTRPHHGEGGTAQCIEKCCPVISQFEPAVWTPRPVRSRGSSAIERILRRGQSSLKEGSANVGASESMMNLTINNFHNETCFEPAEDGTGSLDRRGWQQKGLGRGGHDGSTHNLMSMSAINGPASFYQEGPGVAIVDGPTTPQRLANFFARPFRTNPLKRTKSVSKLDRKRVINDHDFTASRPELQRSQENVCSLGASSVYAPRWPTGSYVDHSTDHNPLRSSRSHESLLSYSTTSHMIDMGAPDVRVHPVHPSVLDVPNCFRVANTYYACRTPVERNRWIENLRRTMNPHRDETRRTENSLEIWILEAKGVPMKRRYYCEICLDKTLVGRTSAKPRADICFWGEHFDYSPIPKVDDLCINLYRDADPKKKKDRSTLIGYVQISIEQLAARHPVERWYTVTASSDGSKLPGLGKDKGEAAAIRIKARYQSVDILPMFLYDELLRFLRVRYLSVCLALEPLLGVRAKEDLATSLVRIMHRQRMVNEFLCDLIMSEVDVLDNEHLMFRGNSLATKAMEAYMKLIADNYLKETLGDFVKSVLESNECCEVDLLKMTGGSQNVLEKNRTHLMFHVQAAWGKIVNSTTSFPNELREIFDSLRRRLEQVNRRDLADTLISSSIFLRFLCPAILSPSLFNLVSEYPSGPAARNLTLIAKTLQTLANFTKFGGKEHYMEFMNEFVTREWDNMHHYLVRISTAPPRNDKQPANSDCDASVDLGKELSLLHSYLDEIWTQQVHDQAVTQDRNLEDMRKILMKLDMRRQGAGDSIGDLQDYESRSAQSPASDYDNTAVLRSRNHNVPAYPYIHGTGQAQVMSRSTPAAHLGTNDDYVLDIALLNDSLAVRQAGIFVQQHRSNAQHKNHRQPVDVSSRERSNRNSAVPYPAEEEGRARLTAYHRNDGVATTSSNASRNSAKSCSTSTTDRHNDDDTDSDENGALQPRHARPPRKGRRRTNGSHSRNETPTRTNVVAPQPPSSGYQSQNHSCSLSSSNSSSPVERTAVIDAQAALKITNKMFTTHSTVPCTSTPPSYEQLVVHDARTPSASPGYNSSVSASTDGATIHDVAKCSLPRTNPRYSGRSSCGTVSVGVVKPTLIDIGNDNDVSVVNASVVRTSAVQQENNNDARQYDNVWTGSEQRTTVSERWVNGESHDGSVQQNQQEIIDKQKREIMRLMKENEELKKHVAASQNSLKVTSISSRTVDSQPFLDSGASEDSYDSLSSFSDNAATLPQKAATHC